MDAWADYCEGGAGDMSLLSLHTTGDVAGCAVFEGWRRPSARLRRDVAFEVCIRCWLMRRGRPPSGGAAYASRAGPSAVRWTDKALAPGDAPVHCGACGARHGHRWPPSRRLDEMRRFGLKSDEATRSSSVRLPEADRRLRCCLRQKRPTTTSTITVLLLYNRMVVVKCVSSLSANTLRIWRWSCFGMGDGAGPPFGVSPRPGDGGGFLRLPECLMGSPPGCICR